MANRMAKRLASVRTGEDEPTPEFVTEAKRDVIANCIYGVDLNEMAVELCKVNLWLESIDPGKPLTFLDAHIRQGNSLLGTTPALMARGIPEDAFPTKSGLIEGDQNKIVSKLRKRNRDERKEDKLDHGDLTGLPQCIFSRVEGISWFSVDESGGTRNSSCGRFRRVQLNTLTGISPQSGENPFSLRIRN